MSVYLYEEAIIERLQKITGDNRIHIVKPDQAISFFAQFDKDKVQFPAIVLSRNVTEINETLKNQVVMLQGQTSALTEENLIVKAQLIPIKVSWSLDVFAVDRFTCDEIIRELTFYFITHPRFLVKVPYNLEIEQNFDIFLEPTIQDNSDLLEFPNKGEFFRETLTIYTENAHFYSSSKQYPTYITLEDVVVDIEK